MVFHTKFWFRVPVSSIPVGLRPVYAGDGYVHRLVQSSTDGKVVELSDPNPFASVGRRLEGSHSDLESDTGDPDKQHAVVASKLDAMAFEYNQLLTQTLVRQRCNPHATPPGKGIAGWCAG